MEKEEKNFIQLDGFKKAIFTLGENSREMPMLELLKMNQFLNAHLKACSSIAHELSYYDDFEKKIDGIIDNMKRDFEDEEQDEDFVYSIGGNYARFMNTSTKSLVYDNHEAALILKEEFDKEAPNNKLNFDDEMSHCYVYSEDKEEARKFMLFVYRKYIFPFLEPWYSGWEEFTQEFSDASDDDKLDFRNIGF